MCIVNRSSEGGATIESKISNTRNAIGDGDRGKGGATLESRTSNARNAVRDGDGGKGGAIFENSISNARYAIGSTVVGNGFGDDNTTSITISSTYLSGVRL